MVDRLWWLDHRIREDESLHSRFATTSCSNAYEVEMAVGLIEYLVKSNEYEYRDIALLTPYNGQLAAFTERLKGKCSVWLSENDLESLVTEGVLDPETSRTMRHANIEFKDMLRLATIDNFQGEESKIVILSLVRSNSAGRVGFMKSQNRINVACSRARNGFYVVGNASLMCKIPMFGQIIDLMESKHTIGPGFRVCCSRHRDKVQIISTPAQWSILAQCEEPCTFTHECGHPCQLLGCHSENLHNRVGCLRPCERIHEACGHPCQKSCGQPCDDCTYGVMVLPLKCGHSIELTCSEVTKGKEGPYRTCEVAVGQLFLPCGHEQTLICGKRNEPLKCSDTCQHPLVCGHKCQRACSECSSLRTHPPCTAACDQKLAQCNHLCQATCHLGQACPPCQFPCGRSCDHRSCKQVCGRICDPCVKSCNRGCEHQGDCTSICCLPCDRLPCGEPCTRILSCGHLCPGLCNETCPIRCLECITGRHPSKNQMTLSCGHQFDLQTLDNLFHVDKIYEVGGGGHVLRFQEYTASMKTKDELRCPTCHHTCKDANRYILHERLRHLEDTIDRLHAKISRKTNAFMEQAYRIRWELVDTFFSFKKRIRPGPLAGRMNELAIRERTNALAGVRESIFKFAGMSKTLCARRVKQLT